MILLVERFKVLNFAKLLKLRGWILTILFEERFRVANFAKLPKLTSAILL